MGVSAFKADPGARVHRGMVRARITLKISGAASRPTIARWCNGITPWYIRLRAGPAECSPRAIAGRYFSGAVPLKPDPGGPTTRLLP
jgi:hypothetical protein